MLTPRRLMLSSAFLAVLAGTADAQILRLAELNTTQIAALDRSRTVVVLPGGIMEQHGPYLPSFSDGYVNELIAQRLAEAIVARPGWTVLMFPTIPLGTGGANEIGGKHVFPGTYAVRHTTLRAVFMDLATEFGEQGFKWIFVIHSHGAPRHNRALDEAGDYFRDSYGGRMVNLLGLTVPGDPQLPDPYPLSEDHKKENGLDIHAGAFETSGVLFLRPDLVGPISQAKPEAAHTLEDLPKLARRPDWSGYFGSPRLATAARGARWIGYAKIQIDYALTILDGADERRAERTGAGLGDHPAAQDPERDSLAREAEIEKKQQTWLKARRPR
jgi:creatinine amidohydrolase/Fe(II)-dependent formamide hydrolase-like protein